MEIKPKWDFTQGTFDTKEVKMLCVPSDKHGEINLCIKDGFNYAIAEIKLYSGNLYVNFKETYDDAVKLGNEIARRWNECETKK